MTTADQVGEPNLTPVQRIGESMADRVERWMPSPFLFAILLTSPSKSLRSSTVALMISCEGGIIRV